MVTERRASPSPSLQSSSPLSRNLPRTAYVHLPWCVRKCPYCDFNSHTASESPPFDEYADALVRDIVFEEQRDARDGPPLQAIFFGGGTPSLFPVKTTSRILHALTKYFPVQDDAEVTLEANPGVAEQKRFRALRDAGINRLSIGVQSFNDAHLHALGRIHDAAESYAAVQSARNAGFVNINLDLMYGLPGQKIKDAVADIMQGINTGAPHISVYQLTIEPRTHFYRHRPRLPEDDIIWEMQQEIEQRLSTAGYERYEISAWARRGYQCRHNINYWQFGDYLGLGAGAHGKRFWHGDTRRSQRHRHPRQYMECAGDAQVLQDEHSVAPQQLPLEFMMNALRLCDGFAPSLFAQRTGLNITDIAAPLAEAEACEFLHRDDARIVASARGLRYLDDVLQMFMR